MGICFFWCMMNQKCASIFACTVNTWSLCQVPKTEIAEMELWSSNIIQFVTEKGGKQSKDGSLELDRTRTFNKITNIKIYTLALKTKVLYYLSFPFVENILLRRFCFDFYSCNTMNFYFNMSGRLVQNNIKSRRTNPSM